VADEGLDRARPGGSPAFAFLKRYCQETAKIASDLQKPDGLSILTQADIAERIWLLPVGKIPGVGSVTAGRLQAMGIVTIIP
jgi:nucleotidyltransferase/DNA polymerase involved in DNA repair